MKHATNRSNGVRKRDSALKKERLLSTAESLFGQKGFSGTSIREIAKAGRVNIGSIYHYFPNKRSLHSSILERAYAGLHTYVQEAAKADDTPKELLRRMVNAAADFLANHPMAHRVILHELLASTKGLDRAIDLHLRKTRVLLNKTLEEGIRLGDFRKMDVELTSFGLMSALFGYFTSRTLFVKLFSEQGGASHFSKNLPFPIFEIVLDGLSDSKTGLIRNRPKG